MRLRLRTRETSIASSGLRRNFRQLVFFQLLI